MDIFFEELFATLPDTRQFMRLMIRLPIAVLIGAVIGLQRERTGKPAGLKTHMLVALGGALFVLGPIEFGMDSDDLSRIIQGIVTGIGFLGGGAILKIQEEREIEGLTTAAGIWMTAAMGIAAGLGRVGLALISLVMTWGILSLAAFIDALTIAKQETKGRDTET